jgi:folate-dependent phosphoribosylglycinamide formyltransferase PurN
VVNLLKNLNIDMIVLAGFMWLVPGNLLTAFPNRIINIHPALLPKYGGKGMYGDRVHKAVLGNKRRRYRDDQVQGPAAGAHALPEGSGVAAQEDEEHLI